jgi:hypothetical protein
MEPEFVMLVADPNSMVLEPLAIALLLPPSITPSFRRVVTMPEMPPIDPPARLVIERKLPPLPVARAGPEVARMVPELSSATCTELLLVPDITPAVIAVRPVTRPPCATVMPTLAS